MTELKKVITSPVFDECNKVILGRTFNKPTVLSHTTSTLVEAIDFAPKSTISQDDYQLVVAQNTQLKLDNVELKQQVDVLNDGLRLDQEEACKKAYDEAYARGLEDATKEMNSKLVSLETLLGTINDEKQRYLQAMSDELLDVVMVSISKIVGESLANKTFSRAAINHAIQQVTNQQVIEVLVSPQDYEMLVHETSDSPCLSLTYPLVADERVRYGGCIIQLDQGSLDARLEQQLEELKKVLLENQQEGQDV
ncbi:MAG: FliH/SctL family protein [Gammaproteobacteria bacterium]|nr:FliH/SctL family protein [Gammaproteobacteria bacterium]MDH5730098.1 FliH/SctL family protein [Gammaproteobacteria bacterium]